MNRKQLIEQAAREMQKVLEAEDYEILNESELCMIFFHVLASSLKVPLNTLRSEISLVNRRRVDFGIRSSAEGFSYEVLVEAKVWIRPLNVSHMSKANVATKKRNECVKDASRLVELLNSRACRNAALLLLERNSSHLKRLLSPELTEKGLLAAEEWLDLNRDSAGKHQEHIGLIWVRPALTNQST